MTKRRKIWLSCLLLVVIVAMAVSPSMAYLTAVADPVVNVFSPAGTISVTLDEVLVDSNGHGTGNRDDHNEYTYEAGAVLDKDPTVHILAGSMECWVYVCVENQLPSEYFTLSYSSDWEYVDRQTTYVDGIATVSTVYRYHTTAGGLDYDVALTPVFTTVTISNYLTEEIAQSLGERTVIVEAYAIQLNGIDQDLADQLAVGYFFDGIDPDSVLSDEQLAALMATVPPEDTATPEPSPTAAATSTPAPAAEAEATPTPTAAPTPTPTPTPTATPEVTPTPTPEVTPTPTPEVEEVTEEDISDEGLSSAIILNK